MSRAWISTPILPAASEEEEEAPAVAEAEAPAAQGWSEEPIDASGLRQAEGTISLTTGEVLYRDVTVQNTDGRGEAVRWGDEFHPERAGL